MLLTKVFVSKNLVLFHRIESFKYSNYFGAAFYFYNKNLYIFFLQYYNGYAEGLLDYNKFHSRLRAGLVIKPNFFSDY